MRDGGYREAAVVSIMAQIHKRPDVGLFLTEMKTRLPTFTRLRAHCSVARVTHNTLWNMKGHCQALWTHESAGRPDTAILSPLN
jgi:hypothetical protein